jgi:hypothetical protein
MYRIFSNRSLPRINAGLVLKPRVRQRLKTINARSQIEAWCLPGGVAPIARYEPIIGGRGRSMRTRDRLHERRSAAAAVSFVSHADGSETKVFRYFLQAKGYKGGRNSPREALCALVRPGASTVLHK